MSTLTRDPDVVQTWLADIRACLRGEYGSAWRSRAECEVRSKNSSAGGAIHLAAIATSWRQVREEFVAASEVG
jgi:hypothetical protein